MNRLLVFEHEINLDNQILIEDEFRLVHINSVLKLESGDQIKVALIGKGLGLAQITKTTSKSVELEVLKVEKSKEQWGDLIIGISRPPTLKKVLEHGASLGARSFKIIKAELSQKSYFQSKLIKNDEYKELLNLGISQSAVFSNIPSVEFNNYFPESMGEQVEQKFVLSPYAEKNIHEYDITPAKPLTLAIGPERGWTDLEIAKFEQQGFTPVSISPSILRVEIATFTALGVMSSIMDKYNKSL